MSPFPLTPLSQTPPDPAPQYFMFPETYGRTLEELAFLFESDTRAEEVRIKVEKQLQQELGDFDYDKGFRTSMVPRTRTTITSAGGKRITDDRFSRWP